MFSRQYGVVKYFLIILGLLLVAIGIVGIFVPGLPTTIFLIAAAACFANSSPWLHDWLLSHPWFGPIIRNWQETRSIPRKAKIIALLMMFIGCIYTWWMLQTLWLKICIFAIMLFPAIFVYRLPLTESLLQSKTSTDSIESENS